MTLEKWLAVTSVALFAMFAGEMISIYNFMAGDELELAVEFDPDSKIFQFISIGAAPAGILAAIPFIMSKRYGSKSIGCIIMAGGAVMLLGMIATYSLIDEIDEKHVTDAIKFTPLLFIVLSAPVIGIGAYLTKERKRRPKKEFF